MQHDVQHAKSSPSIKRDIYNCENRFSETENLLLNNNLSKVTQTLATGVTLEYNKYVASLKIKISSRAFTAGWNKVGTVPEEAAPQQSIYFCLADDTVNSHEYSEVVFGWINPSGEVQIFAYADRLTLAPSGCVTYLI